MSQTCPSCEAPASGRFCPQCGVAIEAQCRECQNPLPAGARFCNQCGLTVAAQAAPARARQPVLPWATAGVAAVALAGALVAPRLGGGEPDPARAAATAAGVGLPHQGAPPAGDASSVHLASMTPS